MAEHLVKYKLEKVGNGYVTPSIIYDGGHVWENTGKVDEMVLIGKADFDARSKYPDNILEIITQEQWNQHNSIQTDQNLTEYKAEQYKKLTDHLFVEALREKELGRMDKWKEYLVKCDEIYNLTEIPMEDRI